MKFYFYVDNNAKIGGVNEEDEEINNNIR